MAPRNFCSGTGLGNGLGQESVALESVRLGIFAGIDIRFASVASRVDDKFRFRLLQMLQQEIEFGIIQFTARERDKRLVSLLKLRCKCLADVAGGAEK